MSRHGKTVHSKHVDCATSKHRAGLERNVQSRAESSRRFAFCLPRCNVLSCRVPLNLKAPAKGRTPVDDSSHSIDYHGAVAVSRLCAARRINQPVASLTQQDAAKRQRHNIRSGPRRSSTMSKPIPDKEDTANRTRPGAAENCRRAAIRTLGPQRPATNVPLGRNEVLIRADQQEKNQDIYNVRGHVEIRFGTNTLHADEASLRLDHRQF